MIHAFRYCLEVSLCCFVQCGPRFELKLYQLKLGTVDQAHAETEWALRSYTRSAKRSKMSTEEQEAVLGVGMGGYKKAKGSL